MLMFAPLSIDRSLRRARGIILLDVTALSLLVAILSPSTAGAKPFIEFNALSLAGAKVVRQDLNESQDIPGGVYSIAPSPFSASSQARYDVIFTPFKGLDPVVATPPPLGNPQTNNIFPLSILPQHRRTSSRSAPARPGPTVPTTRSATHLPPA
jgi:hypothetical protein